jgi:hypothetical protein
MFVTTVTVSVRIPLPPNSLSRYGARAYLEDYKTFLTPVIWHSSKTCWSLRLCSVFRSYTSLASYTSIHTAVLRDIFQFLHKRVGIVPLILQQHSPSTFFSRHYTITIMSFDITDRFIKLITINWSVRQRGSAVTGPNSGSESVLKSLGSAIEVYFWVLLRRSSVNIEQQLTHVTSSWHLCC